MMGMLDEEFVLAARTGLAVLITEASRAQREARARLGHSMSAQRQGRFIACSITNLPVRPQQPPLHQLFAQARGGTLSSTTSRTSPERAVGLIACE
jgi:hypothetical protein